MEPTVARRTSPLAVASLVSGILGVTLFPFLASIAAVITGHLARKEIRESGGRLEGDGLALAGLILGYGAFVLGCLAIAVALLIFGASLLTMIGIEQHR